MSCIFHVSGKDLNVDKVLRALTIKPYKISRRGESVFKTKPNGKKLTHSGLSFEASNADFDDLKTQIIDSINFLKKYKTDLKKLTFNKSVEFSTLDFGISLRMGYDNAIIQSDYFPFELLKLAGNLRIGIEVSLYPPDLEEQMKNKKVLTK